MERRKVTARKDHDCRSCGEIIRKGNECFYYETRLPIYDSDDNQIGIEYYKGWKHLYDCGLPDVCADGEHDWEKEMELDHYVGAHKVGAPTGRIICNNCFRYKEDIDGTT